MKHDQLISLFWELNFIHFGGILPAIEVRFSRRLKTTGGMYFWKPRRYIQISARYLNQPHPWKEIRDTLGHEMVHYWLDFRGRPCGHTAEFHRKLRECGFARYSRLAPLGTRYIYACPSCGKEYFRKCQGVWSCGPCSGRRFNPQFLLILKTKTPPEIVISG